MLPEKLNKCPEIGDIFSCHLQGNYIRSMRIPSKDTQAENQFRLFALDSGEEYDCNFEDLECFQILPYLKRAPSLALFCQILDFDSGVDSKSLLTKNLNEFVEFQVIRVDSAQAHGFHPFLDIFSVNVRSKYLDNNENGDAINLNCPGNLDYQEFDDFPGRSGNQKRNNSETSSWRPPPNDYRQDSLNDSESWKVPENNEIFVEDFYKLKVPQEEDSEEVKFDFKDQSSHQQQKVPEISSPDPFDRNNATKISAQKRKMNILQNDSSKQKNYGEEFTWNNLEGEIAGDFEGFVSGLTSNLETYV